MKNTARKNPWTSRPEVRHLIDQHENTQLDGRYHHARDTSSQKYYRGGREDYRQRGRGNDQRYWDDRNRSKSRDHRSRSRDYHYDNREYEYDRNRRSRSRNRRDKHRDNSFHNHTDRSTPESSGSDSKSNNGVVNVSSVNKNRFKIRDSDSESQGSPARSWRNERKSHESNERHEILSEDNRDMRKDGTSPLYYNGDVQTSITVEVSEGSNKENPKETVISGDTECKTNMNTVSCSTYDPIAVLKDSINKSENVSKSNENEDKAVDTESEDVDKSRSLYDFVGQIMTDSNYAVKNTNEHSLNRHKTIECTEQSEHVKGIHRNIASMHIAGHLHKRQLSNNSTRKGCSPDNGSRRPLGSRRDETPAIEPSDCIKQTETNSASIITPLSSFDIVGKILHGSDQSKSGNAQDATTSIKPKNLHDSEQSKGGHAQNTTVPIKSMENKTRNIFERLGDLNNRAGEKDKLVENENKNVENEKKKTALLNEDVRNVIKHKSNPESEIVETKSTERMSTYSAEYAQEAKNKGLDAEVKKLKMNHDNGDKKENVNQVVAHESKKTTVLNETIRDVVRNKNKITMKQEVKTKRLIAEKQKFKTNHETGEEEKSMEKSMENENKTKNHRDVVTNSDRYNQELEMADKKSPDVVSTLSAETKVVQKVKSKGLNDEKILTRNYGNEEKVIPMKHEKQENRRDAVRNSNNPESEMAGTKSPETLSRASAEAKRKEVKNKGLNAEVKKLKTNHDNGEKEENVNQIVAHESKKTSILNESIGDVVRNTNKIMKQEVNTKQLDAEKKKFKSIHKTREEEKSMKKSMENEKKTKDHRDVVTNLDRNYQESEMPDTKSPDAVSTLSAGTKVAQKVKIKGLNDEKKLIMNYGNEEKDIPMKYEIHEDGRNAVRHSNNPESEMAGTKSQETVSRVSAETKMLDTDSETIEDKLRDGLHCLGVEEDDFAPIEIQPCPTPMLPNNEAENPNVSDVIKYTDDTVIIEKKETDNKRKSNSEMEKTAKKQKLDIHHTPQKKESLKEGRKLCFNTDSPRKTNYGDRLKKASKGFDEPVVMSPDMASEFLKKAKKNIKIPKSVSKNTEQSKTVKPTVNENLMKTGLPNKSDTQDSSCDSHLDNKTEISKSTSRYERIVVEQTKCQVEPLNVCLQKHVSSVQSSVEKQSENLSDKSGAHQVDSKTRDDIRVGNLKREKLRTRALSGPDLVQSPKTVTAGKPVESESSDCEKLRTRALSGPGLVQSPKTVTAGKPVESESSECFPVNSPVQTYIDTIESVTFKQDNTDSNKTTLKISEQANTVPNESAVSSIQAKTDSNQTADHVDTQTSDNNVPEPKPELPSNLFFFDHPSSALDASLFSETELLTELKKKFGCEHNDGKFQEIEFSTDYETILDG